jgi:23S rRNA pseudouridine1911/1915/1917 synthase
MARPPALEILFQDQRLVAVNKPADLAAIPGRGEATSVLEQLAAQLQLPHKGEQDPRVRVVHRLDKDTTGVLLFAKDRDAQRHLSHQFQNNTITKEYLALVAGRPIEPAGEIDAPLAPNPASPRRMMVTASRGRPARTLWRLAEHLGPFSLLRVFPKTGKTHQIRVHLKSIGLPLAVDPLYNAVHAPHKPGVLLSSFKRNYRSTPGQDERPLIDRLTLHAERLAFEHVNGEHVEITAPLPKDFRAVLNMLRKYAGNAPRQRSG